MRNIYLTLVSTIKAMKLRSRLTAELWKVRAHRLIFISMSEEFFGICDDATRLAEDYSQEKASALNYLEGLVIVDIVGLVATFAVELVRAVRTAALNRELGEAGIYFR